MFLGIFTGNFKPFDVILDDDKVVTITNEEDFKELKDYCDY